MSRNGRRRSQPRQPSAGSSRPADPTPNDHPRLPPNAIETLVALVTAGELDSDLPLLYNTIGDRLNADHCRSSRQRHGPPQPRRPCPYRP
jgi:hypothetical protein